jgi:hypothetical protein
VEPESPNLTTYSINLEDITVCVISSELISGAVETEDEFPGVCDGGSLHGRGFNQLPIPTQWNAGARQRECLVLHSLKSPDCGVVIIIIDGVPWLTAHVAKVYPLNPIV